MSLFRLLSFLFTFLYLAACTTPGTTTAPQPSSNVKRVIVIGLDNYHFDDVQAKMPNLYGFLQKGALSAKSHHPSLPTKTAPGFATIASGQYPARHGVLNNSFLTPGGNPPARAGFGYWENLAKRSPPTFLTTPPWESFNAAGWDVGAIGWQGLVLENKDEATGYLGRTPSDAELDRYWGIAIHRKDGKAQLGVAEIPELQEEFASGWVNGWAGPPLKSASITLRMGTRLLAAGVPFVFIYVENTHQRCTAGATPPCQGNLAAGTFDDLLRADDGAFGRFFGDLEKLGVTPANTLFVVTTDEGDHYVANGARPVDASDLQPAVIGVNSHFYGPDADAIGAALAKRGGFHSFATREAMKALHIASAPDARLPTLTAFSDPETTYVTRPCAPCGRWNHGTIHPDITDIWLGVVGPGVRQGALDAYTDHADILPTVRALLGLPASTEYDGVAITPALNTRTSDDLLRLRTAFKDLNAPFGTFGTRVLAISTKGVLAGADARAAADARIRDLAGKRGSLVGEMRAVLDGKAGESSDQMRDLLRRVQSLLDEAAR